MILFLKPAAMLVLGKGTVQTGIIKFKLPAKNFEKNKIFDKRLVLEKKMIYFYILKFR